MKKLFTLMLTVLMALTAVFGLTACNKDDDLKNVKKAGVFATLSGTVENLSILNSFFAANNFVGSVAGNMTDTATISKVYSDAYLYSYSTSTNNGFVAYSGGIVGVVGNIDTIAAIDNGTYTIDNCQYAGYFHAAGNSADKAQKAGGILGYATGDVTVSNCIVTGTIICGRQGGGIIGVIYSVAIDVEMTNCLFYGKMVSLDAEGTATWMGALIGVIWKSNASIEMSNCYFSESYGLIYTKEAANKYFYTSAIGVHTGATLNAKNVGMISQSTSGSNTESGLKDISVTSGNFKYYNVNNKYSAADAVAAMNGVSANTWSAQTNNLPALKTVVSRFANAEIRAAGMQPRVDDNALRMLAVVDADVNLENYSSVSYRIEVITSEGTYRDNTATTTLYSSILANGEPVSAESLGGQGIHVSAVKNLPTGEDITVICTPMLKSSNGVYVSGTPAAYTYQFTSSAQ